MWSSTRSIFSQGSSASTTASTSTVASEVKSWKQAFTSSLLTLGEEKVIPDADTDASNRSIANSTLSGGLSRQYSTNSRMKQQQKQHQQQQQHHHARPPKDSVSVLTCDNDDHGFDDFDNHPAALLVATNNELLHQKEEELNQLMELQALQAQALVETRAELTKLQMEHKQQERQWAMSIEDLQYQKNDSARTIGCYTR